jgi:predicted nucleic acid-binding protein
MIISFDSMVLIWATKRAHYKNTSTIEEPVKMLQKRARYLLELIEEEDYTVVLPTIVASEFLCGVKPENRSRVLSKLHETYILATFDVSSALIAANVFEQAKQVSAKDFTSRVSMKADLKIVSNAKSMKVKRFYSHDAGTRKLAELAGMEARDLPTAGRRLTSDLDESD